MTLTVDKIAKRLKQTSGFDEWIIRERVVSSTLRELSRNDLSANRFDHRFDVSVLLDRRADRGEASFEVGPADEARLSDAIDTALERAAAATGPSWRLPPPAAPARVLLADEMLSADPESVIADLAARLGTPTRGTLVTLASIRIDAGSNRVRLSSGLDHTYRFTEVAIGGALNLGKAGATASKAFARRRLRLADLDVEGELALETELLTSSGAALPLEPRTYDLVFAAEALAPDGQVDSWLAPFAEQASAQLIRRGLARYQPGQAVSDNSDGDSVRIASDGTIDFALESAPVDEGGAPVRRFDLVTEGRAVGVALNLREAALSGTSANGGARNLSIATGTRSLNEMTDGSRPRLVISALDYLRIDRATGEAIGQIALASSSESKQLRTGGDFAFNIFDAIGRVRLSSEKAESGRGPAWIGIPEVKIHNAAARETLRAG